MNFTSIVRVTPSGLQPLVDLSRKTFLEKFYADNTPENMKEFMDRVYDPEQLKKELLDPLCEFYFMFLNGALAGYLKINQESAQSDIRDNSSLEIERLYIDAEFQGKGLGTKFLEKAEHRARELNLQYLWLGVWEKNPDAIRFYTRHGYVQFGSHPVKVGDEMQTDFLMRKEVAI
jgi:ribosomal protein S18 acetylase RimI-like enzyme